MEQNRTLMIIVSVAVFLAAIVGVGVALLYPRGDGADSVAEGRSVEEFDPIEYVRRPDSAPLEEVTDESEPVIIVYGADDEGVADEALAPVEEPVATTVIRVTPEPVAAEPAAQPRTFGPTGPRAVATAAPAERAPEPRTERVTEYWIQLIASPSRDRVEQALLSIEELGVSGRITTRDVDDTLYYRLRVGPYQSKDEAEKFLGWIQEIDRFAEAYISEEYPVRTLGG